MSYQAPKIDATGIHVPDYVSIRDFLLEEFKRIFGQDLYLGADSQDYQMVSLFADVVDDVNALAIEAYNSRNPDYARGNSLDLLLPLNGLTRIGATHSTVTLTLSGDADSVIVAGSVAKDAADNRWITQQDAVIGVDGTVSVPARAENSGHITAGIGAIYLIGTPTAGWVSVTNPAPAVPGRNVESDAELRERRLASVENVSIGVLQSMVGSIYEISGVSRVTIYENADGTVDSHGIPAHSICVVVHGGADAEIANAIYAKKSPGCGLYGDVTVNIVDPFGSTVAIKFMRPIMNTVKAEVTLRAFNGYSADVADRIKAAVSEYISARGIGEPLETGFLWGIVLGQNPSVGSAVFAPTSIKTGLEGDPLTDQTIVPAFNERLQSAATDVTIVTV